MTKKEVKNENVNTEVKEEEIVDVQEETLEEEEETVEESKLKKGINWIKNHKTEIALGAVAVVGGMIGYALRGTKEEDIVTTAISNGDTVSIEMNPDEPVDVEVTSEEPVSEKA